MSAFQRFFELFFEIALKAGGLFLTLWAAQKIHPMLPACLIGAFIVWRMFHGKHYGETSASGGAYWPFHRHKLTVLSKTYAPPYDAERRLQGELAFLSKVLMGCTTYVIGCECGKIMTVEALGREDRGAVEIKFREVPGKRRD